MKLKVKNYLAHGLFGRQFEDLILKKLNETSAP